MVRAQVRLRDGAIFLPWCRPLISGCAVSVRGALSLLGFGFRQQHRMLFFSASVAPNSSFKPTPYLGFVEIGRSAGNTGPRLPRSARLNSSVSLHRDKIDGLGDLSYRNG